jgi:DNA-binding NarL/FixJ family response regulator
LTPAIASSATRRSIRAVAIYSADRALGGQLERLLGADAGLAVVGVAGDLPAFARLFEKNRIDVALVYPVPPEQLSRWQRRYRQTEFVAIVDSLDDGLAAVRAGIRAVVSRSADDADVAATVSAAARGLAVMPPELLHALQPAPNTDSVPRPGAGETLLTSRELEVLAAMADGASNKAIARRLGISFHTVKFHVAGILAKLDADSRTEAVTKAAQLGLVML